MPLPLPPGAEARVLLHHLLKHGGIVGRDTVGRTIIQLGDAARTGVFCVLFGTFFICGASTTA